MSKYTTGEIAKLCGVSVRTVQYYDTRNILTPSELTEGGRRLYSEEDLKRMKIICFLRDAGISINSIGELLSEHDPGSVISVLLEQQENILKEEKSESTQQNFEFSRALLEQAGIRADEPIAYVTNRFHIYRSGIFARKAGFTNARAIPASISFGTIAPSYLREVLAVCHVWVFG